MHLKASYAGRFRSVEVGRLSVKLFDFDRGVPYIDRRNSIWGNEAAGHDFYFTGV
jgi:hypothetical protein